MKKIVLTMVAACAALTMNAQMYVGGSLGFSSDTDKKNPAAEKTVTIFNLNPEFGMALDEKMGVGIQLGFGLENKKTEDKTATPVTSTKTNATTIQIKPYLRYQVLTFGKANIFVDGGVDFGMKKEKDMKPSMDLGLFVTPGFAFNINETWSIVAKMNDMFAFGYHKDAVADVAGAPDAPSSIKAGLSTGGFNLGDLTFGVYYNF